MARDPERAKAYNKEWRTEHLERAMEQSRASAKRWREAHPEEMAAYLREWGVLNRDKKTEYSRQWRAQHPERATQISMRAWYKRLARMKTVEHEDVDRLAIYERDGGRCYLCGNDVEPQEYEMDHVVPLSKGGPHLASNLATTHRSCNRIKAAK